MLTSLRSTCLFLWAYCASAYDEADLKFLQDFTSDCNFNSNLYNLITCREPESINLIKMLSASFGRFVAVHRADKALRPFLDEPQTFILNARCSQGREILEEAELLSLFGKPYRWLLLADGLVQDNGNISEGGETSLWTFIQTLSVLTDSDLQLVERNPDGKFSVTGAYKITHGGSLIMEPLAEWTPEGGLVVLNPKPMTIRRWNLQGVTMRSSLVLTHQDSLNHLEDTVDKHIDMTSKTSYNMVKLYEDTFNMSIDFKIVTEWGVLQNGSWTGMVGDIQRNEVEFGSAPMFFQKHRLGIVEYYASVTPSRAKFLFLSPPLSYSSNIFVLPFDTIVWYCCLITVAVSSFFLYAALNFEKRNYVDETENLPSNISFSEILILNIGAICLQGTAAQTKKPPGRIISIFLYLSYMFMYISYSAAIVAILQSSDHSIRSFQDFLRSPLEGGADDIVYSQYYFKNEEEEVRKTIYLKKIAPKGEAPHFYPSEEGIRRVQGGFFAFHVELSTGYLLIQKTFTEEEKCAIQELEGNYFQTGEPWLSMRRKSPYSEHFKIGMKRNIERGFKSRFVQRYFTKKPVCSVKSARFASVGIIDCYYAFVLLFSGFGLSLLILLSEFAFSKYYNRRERRKLIETPRFTFIN